MGEGGGRALGRIDVGVCYTRGARSRRWCGWWRRRGRCGGGEEGVGNAYIYHTHVIITLFDAKRIINNDSFVSLLLASPPPASAPTSHILSFVSMSLLFCLFLESMPTRHPSKGLYYRNMWVQYTRYRCNFSAGPRLPRQSFLLAIIIHMASPVSFSSFVYTSFLLLPAPCPSALLPLPPL